MHMLAGKALYDFAPYDQNRFVWNQPYTIPRKEPSFEWCFVYVLTSKYYCLYCESFFDQQFWRIVIVFSLFCPTYSVFTYLSGICVYLLTIVSRWQHKYLIPTYFTHLLIIYRTHIFNLLLPSLSCLSIGRFPFIRSWGLITPPKFQKLY